MISAAKSLASDINWKLLESFLTTSPWFKRNCPLSERGRLKDESTVILPKNCIVSLGSTYNQFLGKAALSGLLDESNFYRSKIDMARLTYNTMLDRITSRFAETEGTLPGVVWCLSSPKSSDDFLYSKIEKLKKEPDPQVLPISNHTWWKIRTDKTKFFSKKYFYLSLGSKDKEPRILSKKTDDLAQVKQNEKTMKVPIELYKTFKRDTISAIKNIGGETGIASSRLFNDDTFIESAMLIDNAFKKRCNLIIFC